MLTKGAQADTPCLLDTLIEELNALPSKKEYYYIGAP
jgi:hypothetical protein